MVSGVRKSANFSDILKMEFIITTLSKKNQIVDFLDNKTEKIYQLIRYKETLIERYKQSMIY